MSILKFEMKQGSLSPALVYAPGFEAGQDLAGATATFSMRHQGTGAVVVNAAAALVDSDAGTLTYVWQAGDTDLVGSHDAEFRVLLGGVTPEIVPPTPSLIVMIHDAI